MLVQLLQRLRQLKPKLRKLSSGGRNRDRGAETGSTVPVSEPKCERGVVVGLDLTEEAVQSDYSAGHGGGLLVRLSNGGSLR